MEMFSLSVSSHGELLKIVKHAIWRSVVMFVKIITHAVKLELLFIINS
jgi:hypothetical protein